MSGSRKATGSTASTGPAATGPAPFAPPAPGVRQRAVGIAPPERSRLAIHTVTTKPWDLETAIERYAAGGVGGISVWRDTVEGRSRDELSQTGARIRDAGLTPVSLVRGGFFASVDGDARTASLQENRAAIAEAEALGMGSIVLVCGADPGQSLEASRAQTVEALTELCPEAADRGVDLLVEPLHPMYSDTRSAVPTLGAANGVCNDVGHPAVGVALDVYHIWWDPALPTEVSACAAGGWLRSFHVCDWKIPTTDMLLDRGIMGEGCIDIPHIRSIVEGAGYSGPIEVEIFSSNRWSMDQAANLQGIVAAYHDYV